ncbi:cyanamide hydratase [Penicillium angulare]|uniref:Cyanamide hydratase n=1 Tax=Penicillium angulare TaxID=116970 RepID=A0A9W9JZU5_9EURO|nr:cyanamide hydratase [Penicillium angulare]
MCQEEIAANGWTSTPANAGAIFGDQPFINKPEPLAIKDIEFPFDDSTVAKTLKYAKEELHPGTFNHSMRVFFYGMAITRQQFPKQAATFSPVTWALACLLHDIGSTESNQTATRMSFDIYGGIIALQILKDFGATTDQAEAVSETIIRHQDLGVDGTITFMGQLIQLATIYDNVGSHPNVKDFGQIIHETTRTEINDTYPRTQWCQFFANFVRKEINIKPWCHSTHIVNFDKVVEANTLMKQWE